MRVENCTQKDVNEILEIYQNARDLQTEKNMVVWPNFEASFIENEILENRQFKIMIDNEIACNWAITLEDPQIWEEKDKGDAIYIHRLCAKEKFRGNRFLDYLVPWSKGYVKEIGREYVRLDTLGKNYGLIKHYTSGGFDFLGEFILQNTDKLPLHYQKEPICLLFEMKA